MLIRTVFSNIHQQEGFKHWHGKDIEIISVIANPKDPKSSPDAMPLIEARLVETGEEAGIRFEEIPDKDWPCELIATLDGMECYINGTVNDFNYSTFLAAYFEYGKQLAEYKEGL